MGYNHHLKNGNKDIDIALKGLNILVIHLTEKVF